MSGWGDYFDQLAADYDADTASMGWRPNERIGELLAPLGLAPASALDLGAGTGQTATMVRGLYPDAALTLVEPSREMVTAAWEKHPDARLEVGYADDFLATDTATYDLVVAIGFLEMVPDLAVTLRAVTEALSPGGHLAMTYEPLVPGTSVQSDAVTVLDAEAGRSIRRFSRAAVAEMAEACGLVRVAAVDFVAYQRGDTLEDVLYEGVVWELG